MSWKDVLPITLFCFFSLQASAVSIPAVFNYHSGFSDTSLKAIAQVTTPPAVEKIGFFQKLKTKLLTLLTGKKKEVNNGAKAKVKWGWIVLGVIVGLGIAFVLVWGSFRPH